MKVHTLYILLVSVKTALVTGGASGIGEATVRVSADTAVWAEAHGGIGGIKVRGLQHEDGHWVSPSYESSGNKIRIDVQGGIGQINVIAD